MNKWMVSIILFILIGCSSCLPIPKEDLGAPVGTYEKERGVQGVEQGSVYDAPINKIVNMEGK